MKHVNTGSERDGDGIPQKKNIKNGQQMLIGSVPRFDSSPILLGLIFLVCWWCSFIPLSSRSKESLIVAVESKSHHEVYRL
jgi:hypothetical protein